MRGYSVAVDRTRWLGVGLGAIVGSALLCVALGFAFERYVMHTVERRTLLEVACPGGRLRIVSELHRSFMSDSGGGHVDWGEWTSGGRTRRFDFDTKAMPLHLGDARPRASIHGEGPLYVHFFVGRSAEGRAIEACVEANAAPITDRVMDLAPWSTAEGERGRVYWRARPSELVPRFTHGARTLEVQRDGQIVVFDGEMESTFARVEVREDGSTAIVCGDPIDCVELSRFVDAEGRSVVDRFGAVTPAR